MSAILRLTPCIRTTEMLRLLPATPSDVSLEIQLTPDHLHRITGMVALPQGVVTASDIGRVLDAAVPMGHDNGCDDIHLAGTLFTLDDQLKGVFPPVGMRGKRLDATVDWCRLPKGWLDGTRRFVSALGHRLVSLELKMDVAT